MERTSWQTDKEDVYIINFVINNACEYIRFAGRKTTATYINPMKNSPSWETNISPASQEILRILRTQKFISVSTRVRHLSPILSQINALPSYLRYNLILSSHLCLVLTSGLFPSGFSYQTSTKHNQISTEYKREVMCATSHHLNVFLYFDGTTTGYSVLCFILLMFRVKLLNNYWKS